MTINLNNKNYNINNFLNEIIENKKKDEILTLKVNINNINYIPNFLTAITNVIEKYKINEIPYIDINVDLLKEKNTIGNFYFKLLFKIDRKNRKLYYNINNIILNLYDKKFEDDYFNAIHKFINNEELKKFVNIKSFKYNENKIYRVEKPEIEYGESLVLDVIDLNINTFKKLINSLYNGLEKDTRFQINYSSPPELIDYLSNVSNSKINIESYVTLIDDEEVEDDEIDNEYGIEVKREVYIKNVVKEINKKIFNVDIIDNIINNAIKLENKNLIHEIYEYNFENYININNINLQDIDDIIDILSNIYIKDSVFYNKNVIAINDFIELSFYKSSPSNIKKLELKVIGSIDEVNKKRTEFKSQIEKMFQILKYINSNIEKIINKMQKGKIRMGNLIFNVEDKKITSLNIDEYSPKFEKYLKTFGSKFYMLNIISKNELVSKIIKHLC